MFFDRHDAGRRLAERLQGLHAEQPVILALPRGGVPVAAEVATGLGAPLDVLVVRKLGCPWQPELGFGAIAEGGVRVINQTLVTGLDLTDADINRVAEREQVELERRIHRYRQGRPAAPVGGRHVIVVDDGIATGFTARSAVGLLRGRGATRVTLATPVAPRETIRELEAVADDLVVLETPDPFWAIGQWYVDFNQTSDEEVIAVLAAADPHTPRSSAADPRLAVEIVTREEVSLPGTVVLPENPLGIVLFAHGSGSSRHSPRNRQVAGLLNDGGLATLLLDLLARDEELDRANVFDVDLLARRLVDTTEWVRAQEWCANLPVAYFGASTGAAAALLAAANLGPTVHAVVSRGGRPDLALEHLPAVTAPTLFIVGGRDQPTIAGNQLASEALQCEHHLEIVPGATHLFEEPGALEQVAELARAWFVEHLVVGSLQRAR